MTFYGRSEGGPLFDVWDVRGPSYRRVNDPNDPMITPENGSALAFLKATFATSKFEHMELGPGKFYQRIARPNLSDPDRYVSPIHPDRELLASSLGQLDALASQLRQLCRVVQPHQSNMKTFGHDIRNLLILASTEVEAHWKGILLANGVAPKKAQSTAHYVKLATPLRLNEYEISLPFYPWLKPFKPFRGWPSETPTKALKWYNAYNNVKHDRENQFADATILNAMTAVCAGYVMIIAQFGGSSFHGAGSSDLSRFFQVSGKPKWKASEYYYNFTSAGSPPVPVAYQF